MIVERVTTGKVAYPLPRPVCTSIHAIDTVGAVVVDVVTTDGARGQGFIFVINADRLAVFEQMIAGLADAFVVGSSVFETERIWQDIWVDINPTGHKGVTIAALAALDVACWDAVGRLLDRPLADVFGRARDAVDTYASSGLWLSDSIDHLQAEAARFLEQGFRAMKLRVGHDDPADDLARARAVREVIGSEVGLLVDANQKFHGRFGPKHAIRLGRLLAEVDPVWLEEPCATHDRVGSADVRAALDVPIASGETEYTRYGMLDLIQARAADILMPDLQRIGGYTEFHRAAALAAAHDLPVSTHFFTEHSLAAAAATTNCISVEHVDWFAPLLNERPELVGGRLLVPDRPGTGFTLADDFIDRHRL